MSDMPAHLRPSVETDGRHVIATFGDHHYIFEEVSSGVLEYSHTESDSGRGSHFKPRKNVIAYLNDIGYEVR